jgi:hypothetical protein
LWNLANRRWEMVLDCVQRWPGPAGYTAREKLVTVFKSNGEPDPNRPKEWTLEAQKGIGFASSVWLRLTRDADPKVVKMRSASPNVIKIIQDAGDEPVNWTGKLELSEVIFDYIGCESGVSRAPDVKTLDADQVLPGEVVETEQPHDQRTDQRHVRPVTELRRERSDEQNVKIARDGLSLLLACQEPDAAKALYAKAEGDPSMKVDVLADIPEQYWPLLSIEASAKRLTLGETFDRVIGHLRREGMTLDSALAVDAADAARDVPAAS